MKNGKSADTSRFSELYQTLGQFKYKIVFTMAKFHHIGGDRQRFGKFYALQANL